jgi:hypothetical protein
MFLKTIVFEISPNLSGYQHNDAHEALQVVLDTLHEDLNRILQKPYTELYPSDGRSDVINAKEAWNIHLKRNQSVIVDLFQGQMKETCYCHECDHSVTYFNPFLTISVPIIDPEPRLLRHVVVFPAHQNIPVKYGVKVNSDATVADLCAQLENLTGYSSQNLLLIEIYNNRLYRTFSPHFLVRSHTKANDFLCAFEVFLEENLVPLKVAHISEDGSRLQANPVILSVNEMVLVGDLYRRCVLIYVAFNK